MSKIDVLKALRLMHTACSVDCSVNLTSGDDGNLRLVWRWRVGKTVQCYSYYLKPDEVCDENIYRVIDFARKEIKDVIKSKAQTGQTT